MLEPLWPLSFLLLVPVWGQWFSDWLRQFHDFGWSGVLPTLLLIGNFIAIVICGANYGRYSRMAPPEAPPDDYLIGLYMGAGFMIAGCLFLLLLLLRPGTRGPNRYGPDPRLRKRPERRENHEDQDADDGLPVY